MKVLVIGDSHAYSGWPDINIPEVSFTVVHIGPRLMYSFGKGKWNLLSDYLPMDVVIFCFGEIDIRCHLFNYANTLEQIQQKIDELVLNYMEAILVNVKNIKIKTCVHFVPPTVKKETVKEDPEYPFVGSDIARRIAVRYMNHRLKVSCKENGFIFVNGQECYEDEEGYLNPNMSDGSVHIKETLPLMDFIYGELLK